MDLSNLPKGSIVVDNTQDKVEGLPNLAQLTKQIIEFIEYIELPEVKEMALNNNMIYKQHLENKFENFTLEYYSIYRMLVDDDKNRANNIESLFKMIDRLRLVELGKSSVDVQFDSIKNELSEKYLYPQFGGKDGFVKAMSKSEKRKKKHKKHK